MMADESAEWMAEMFNALTSQQISRNKNFSAFSSRWSKQVLRRFRTIRALIREAERLAEVPGTTCWVGEDERGLVFNLDCPRMRYRRSVVLYGFEWEWLGQQSCVQALLSAKSLEAGATPTQ